MSEKQILIFFEYISNLLNSNLDFIECLDIYIKKYNDKNINNLKKDLEKGISISKAFKKIIKNQEIIYCISLIEFSGNFKDVFNFINQNLKKKKNLKSKILEAFAYPFIILTISFILITLIFLYIIPNFINIYTELNVDLPKITRFMIYISSNIKSIGFSIISIFILIYFGIKYIKKNFNHLYYNLIFKIKIFYLYENIQLTNIISFLLESNISFENSIEIILKSSHNELIKKELNDILTNIKKGNNIFNSFKNSIFDSIFLDYIYIGVETNNLKSSFNNLNKFYETEFNFKINLLIKLIEPFSIILISIIILIIILSISIPIFNLPRYIV